MAIRRSWAASVHLLVAALLWIASAVPAHAAVTITFWSKEFGNSFPHAFFTLKGVPDAGGEAVDLSFGFTAKAISPAILMGSVPGMIDRPKPRYVQGSNAHFSLTLTDRQYADVLRLVEEWGENGDHVYNLNRRNCVHFVAEAARRSGLNVAEEKRLMKKPRSFTQSVARANEGRVRTLEMPAEAYFALLEREAGGTAAVAAGARR